MADLHTFTPDELDRLEDALESMESDGGFSEPVAARLADYRQLLAMTREALPIEDPSPNVVAAILAAAREEHVDSLRLESAPAQKTGLWARLRRAMLVPSLAVAGSAALILLVARPHREASSPEMQASSRIEAKVEAIETAPLGTAQPARPGGAEPATPEAAAPSPPAPAQAPAPAPDPADAPLYEIARSRQEQGLGGLGSGAAEGRAKADKKTETPPASAPVAGDATPRWDQIARGDRARMSGDCAAAQKEYTAALEDVDARVQARAAAGLGLCEERAGRLKSAQEHYSRAGGLDPDIEGFIARESKPGEMKAKPAKAKARATAVDSAARD